jgi:hypothetical protein
VVQVVVLGRGGLAGEAAGDVTSPQQLVEPGVGPVGRGAQVQGVSVDRVVDQTLPVGVAGFGRFNAAASSGSAGSIGSPPGAGRGRGIAAANEATATLSCPAAHASTGRHACTSDSHWSPVIHRSAKAVNSATD